MALPNQNLQSSTLRLTLVGPSGVGKTWMLHALAKELQWYSRQDDQFNYELAQLNPGGGAPIPVVPAPPTQGPTATTFNPNMGMRDNAFVFTRRAANPSAPAQLLSQHKHDIAIFDDAGANFVDVVSGGGTRVIQKAIVDAASVILLLDSTYSQVAGAGGGGTFATQHEYLTFVQSLCHMLASVPVPQRYLAVCATKIDQTGMAGRSSQQVIEMLFGAQMLSTIEQYSSVMNINYFQVSSVGYYRTPQGVLPNFDEMSGSVMNPNQWLPYNVVAPFFWIFEQIERQRISKTTRPVSRFLRSDRNNQYIRYPNIQKYPITISFF